MRVDVNRAPEEAIDCVHRLHCPVAPVSTRRIRDRYQQGEAGRSGYQPAWDGKGVSVGGKEGGSWESKNLIFRACVPICARLFHHRRSRLIASARLHDSSFFLS